MLIAFTGGARSGKSTAAVRAALATGAPVTFIATAEAGDDEMAARIERHQAERPVGWVTVEAPVGLVAAVEQVDPAATIVIDCLSMWVSNRMLAEVAAVETERAGASSRAEQPDTDPEAEPAGEAVARAARERSEQERETTGVAAEGFASRRGSVGRSIVAEAADLGERLRERNGTAIVVTNEVGSGIVPATSLGRAYRDVLGSANQAIFASADRAYLVVAGRLLELQDPSDAL